MITEITQAFHSRGRMHLLTPVRKTNRDIYQEYDADAEKHQALFLASMYNLVCINDIVIGLVGDAFSEVKHSILYKNKLKQTMNQVEKKMKTYERLLNNLTSNCSENYAEANDAFFTSDLADSITKLRFLFKNELDKHHIPNSHEIAWLEVARVMLDYSVSTRKVRERELNKATRRGVVYFNALDLSDILATYERMFQYIKIGRVIDLNTPQNKAMFAQIDRQCSDINRIQATINKMSNEI